MKISRVYIITTIITLIVAAISLLTGDKKFLISIIAGSTVAQLNYKGLSMGVNAFIQSPQATAALTLLTIFRLLAVFVIIGALFYLKLVSITGIFTGITILLIIAIADAFAQAKKT